MKQLQSILTDLDNKVITKHQAYDLILVLFDVSKCEGIEREDLLKLKQFVANQKDLPDDINQIVNDNFWKLF